MDVAPRRAGAFHVRRGRDAAPVWSADGKAIAWQGNTAMFVKDSSGTRPEGRVRDEPCDSGRLAARTAAASSVIPNAPLQIVIIPMVGTDRTPQAVVEGRDDYDTGTPFAGRALDCVRQQRFGPIRGLRPELPEAGRAVAGLDRWRPPAEVAIATGRNWYYLGLDSRLMAAPSRSARSRRSGKPAPLFATRVEPTTGSALAPVTMSPAMGSGS